MKSFEYTGSRFSVTPEIKAAFDDFGFVILKNLFKRDEVKKLIDFFENSQEIQSHAYGRDDGEGRKTRVALWNYPGDDIGSAVSRSKRVVYTLRDLLGGHELYHYHTKLMMKDAKTGGRHVWHQDYGYWYLNGCLTPDMGSVFIALDECSEENGCLKVIPRSQKMGRVDHILIGNQDEQNQSDALQRGADPERVKWAIERYGEPVPCVLEPGDAIFFHSNLLHTSDGNRSDKRRWTLISSFNQAKNDQLKECHHPKYYKLDAIENDEDAVMKCDRSVSSVDKWYYFPSLDGSGNRKV